jgi:hypothetical protein
VIILCGNQSGKARIRELQDGERILTSGEQAQYSGLYGVYHESRDSRREVFIQKGTELPLCEDCGKAIKFELLEKILHITEDPDFC